MGCICSHPNKQRGTKPGQEMYSFSKPRKLAVSHTLNRQVFDHFADRRKEEEFRLRLGSKEISTIRQRSLEMPAQFGSESQRTQVPQQEKYQLDIETSASNLHQSHPHEKKIEKKVPLSSKSSVKSGPILEISDSLDLSQPHNLEPSLRQHQAKDHQRRPHPAQPVSLKLLGEIDQLKKRNYFISHDLPSRIEEKENEESHFTTEHQQSDKPILEPADQKPISRVNSNSNLLAVLHRYCQSTASITKPETEKPGSLLLQPSAKNNRPSSRIPSREHTNKPSLKLISDGKPSIVSVRVFRNYNRVNLLDSFAPGKLIQTAISQKKTNRPLPLKQLSKPSEEPPSPLRNNAHIVFIKNPIQPYSTHRNSSDWNLPLHKKSHSSAESPCFSNTNKSHVSPRNFSAAMTPQRNCTRRNSIISLRKLNSIDITPSSLGPSSNTTVIHHVQVLSPKKSRRDLGCKIEGLRTKIEHYILLKSIGRGSWAEDIWLVLDTRTKCTYVASR